MTNLKLAAGYVSRRFDQFDPLINIGGLTGEEIGIRALGNFFYNEDMYKLIQKENGSIQEIRGVIREFGRFAESVPGGRVITASTFVAGNPSHYMMFYGEFPEDTWNPALAALPFGFFTGLNKRNGFVLGQTFPSSENLYGAVVDTSKNATQRLIAGRDELTAAKSGYVLSHIFGDLATGFFAMLPEISGGIIPERELLEFKLQAPSIQGAMFPDGYDTSLVQSKSYAEISHEELERLLTIYPDARGPVQSWFSRMDPLFYSLDTNYQGFTYENAGTVKVPSIRARFDNILNGRVASGVSKGLTLIKREGKPQKDSFILKSRVGHVLMSLMGTIGWLGAIKVPTLLVNNCTYGTALIIDRIAQVTEKIRNGEITTDMINTLELGPLESILKYAETTIDPDAKNELKEQKLSLPIGFRAFDELVGAYKAAEMLRNGIAQYIEQEDKNSAKIAIMRASGGFEPPMVRLAKVWGYWSKLKNQTKLWKADGGKQPEEITRTLTELNNVVEGGNRDSHLIEYMKLFYDLPLKNKKVTIANELESVIKLTGKSYASAKEMISEMEAIENNFVALSLKSPFANGEYSAEPIFFPVVPDSDNPLKVYEPFGQFAARIQINAFKVAATENLFPGRPEYVALGASLVSGKASGFKSHSGWILDPGKTDSGIYYTQSNFVSGHGRNTKDLPKYEKYRLPVGLSSAYLVRESLNAMTEGAILLGQQDVFAVNPGGVRLQLLDKNRQLRTEVSMHKLSATELNVVGTRPLFW